MCMRAGMLFSVCVRVNMQEACLFVSSANVCTCVDYVLTFVDVCVDVCR